MRVDAAPLEMAHDDGDAMDEDEADEAASIVAAMVGSRLGGLVVLAIIRVVLLGPQRKVLRFGLRRGLAFPPVGEKLAFTLSHLGTPLVRLLSLAIHISPNNGPINIVSNAKPISHVLPIHCAL